MHFKQINIIMTKHRSVTNCQGYNMYYLKHCRQFVWYIQLEVRVKWQIEHEVKPSAIFVTRLSPRAVYTIQRKWQHFKCFIVFCTY